jgi:integrase
MATLTKDRKGWRIRWYTREGERKSLRFGRCSERVANQLFAVTSRLIDATEWGLPPDPKVKAWLENLHPEFVSKLQKAGLLESVRQVTLGQAVTEFLERSQHYAAWTLSNIHQAFRYLITFFGEDRPLGSVTVADVEDYKRWLLYEAQTRRARRGLSEATAAKHLSWAGTLYRDFIKRKVVTHNPFDGVQKGSQVNRDRRVYVPAAIIETLIERAPSLEWKLLLAMARYMGVRVPSEPFSMTWDCVDWERLLIRVPSPKTAKQGKPFRMVPIFPPVRRHLEALWEQAEGKTYIFEELRKRDSMKNADQGKWKAINLRERLRRMLIKAGIAPWPKLWQNLRSSAEMDLLARFPPAAVYEWIGHTADVARGHYFQIRQADIEKAISEEWAPPDRAVDLKVAPQSHTRMYKGIQNAN